MHFDFLYGASKPPLRRRIRNAFLTKAETIRADVWWTRTTPGKEINVGSVEWATGDLLIAVSIFLEACVGGPRKPKS